MLNGRKIYLNKWFDLLMNNIEYNTKLNYEIYNNVNPVNLKIRNDRNKKLENKLKKYKKTDSNGGIYCYFFPNELEMIMWIMLENNCYKIKNFMSGKTASNK